MNNTTGTNEEKGDVLLFLHGWGCDGTIFKGLASTFKGVRCLTPDFRGFGCNPPPDRPWTIEDYARDVAEYLEQLHCGKVTVIAHSFGCRVATVLAAEYPRYVKAMLFTGPAGFRRFSLKRWLSVTEYKFKKKLCALGILPFRCLERYGSEDYRNASPEMRSTFLKVVNSDVSKYALKIKCPLLVTVGNKDEATPLWMAKRYCKLVADSALVMLDGDHFAFLRDGRFVAVAHSFVRGVR